MSMGTDIIMESYANSNIDTPESALLEETLLETVNSLSTFERVKLNEEAVRLFESNGKYYIELGELQRYCVENGGMGIVEGLDNIADFYISKGYHLTTENFFTVIDRADFINENMTMAKRGVTTSKAYVENMINDIKTLRSCNVTVLKSEN